MRPKHARPATKADETPEFQEFWKTWQKVKSEYDGRGLARDAFFRFVWWKDADPQDIVDGAHYYASTYKQGQFRLLTQTWLERGMYEDDAEKWRALQARLSQAKERPANVVEMKPQLPASHFLNRYKQGA